MYVHEIYIPKSDPGVEKTGCGSGLDSPANSDPYSIL